MLLIGGKPAQIPDANRVEDNIIFKPGFNKNTKAHEGTWHGHGIHWTGGEGSVDRLIRVLTERELGIHFACAADGRLVQLADLTTYCAHIGSPGNARFIGTETTCRGFATKEDWEEAARRDPDLRVREDIDWDAPRDAYVDTIAGNRARFAAFNPEQVRSLVWLSETLSGLFNFPRVIPARRITMEEMSKINWPFPNPERMLVSHGGATWMPLFDRDKRKIATSRAGTFRGTLGHFHVHEDKMDPGTQVFYALWAEGWNPAGKRLPGIIPL
jgi:hypothetical protein